MKRQKQNAGTKCKLKDQSMSMKIADLEKVLKCHQAENTEIYNVLIIRAKGKQEICWCGIMESPNLECSSLIHSPPLSIFNTESSFLHSSNYNVLYPTSIFHLPFFFLHSLLKYPQNSFMPNIMSASAACNTCSFFQVWKIAWNFEKWPGKKFTEPWERGKGIPLLHKTQPSAFSQHYRKTSGQFCPFLYRFWPVLDMLQ